MLTPGAVLQNRYLLLDVLGGGGTSRVFLAQDMQLETRRWAIKALLVNSHTSPAELAQMKTQFRQEATLMASLRHRNLPDVAEFFEEANSVFLVMEYVKGETLTSIIDRHPQGLSEPIVLKYASQISAALNYLHSRQPPIIFRDVKPDNVMVTDNGTIKLIDFGIARVFKPTASSDTAHMGTMGYAPPEQYQQGGQTDPRSDVYATGATLHHLLTGRDPTQEAPFTFPPVRELAPAVSANTEKVIMKALAYERGERWQTVKEMRLALTGRRPARQSTVQVGKWQRTAEMKAPVAHSNRTPPTSSRPTTKLVLRATRLSKGQRLLAGVLAFLLISIGLWTFTPFLGEMDWFWYNVPAIAMIGPFAYAATRQRGMMGLAQIIAAYVGGAIIWSRVDNTGSLLSLLVGAVLSGVAMEGMVVLFPRVFGQRNREAPGTWQREMGWLTLAAIIGYLVLNLFALPGFNIVAWIGAAILGAVGWFLGDLIRGYVQLHRTGFRS